MKESQFKFIELLQKEIWNQKSYITGLDGTLVLMRPQNAFALVSNNNSKEVWWAGDDQGSGIHIS